ncbi:hypothetical protein BRD04_10600 [Halobacteriales archaeon QS_9_67_17]|nr:MAG: hypothetical protein BRD04_10600 [Halobacteriales archaeon QS_9_67_17]
MDDTTGVSRREFTKATGGAALLAGATSPAAADALRETTRAGTATTDPITSSFTPERWLTIGPFQYQRRDTAVDWLFPAGGSDDFANGDTDPTAGDTLPSAFAGGASVEWRETAASGSTVPFPDAAAEIDPTGGDLTPLTNLAGGADGYDDDFQNWFGLGGVLYGIGYAFTTIERDTPGRAVLETNATVWLNGRKYEESPAGVVLQAGTNYLLAKTFLIFGRFGTVDITFRPPRAPVEVTDLDAFRGTPQNAVVPELRVGEDDTDLPASVRVTNTTGERVDEATLTFAPDDRADGDLLVTQTESIDPPLAPFETRRINTRVQLPGATDGQTATPDGTQPSQAAAERAESRTTTTEVPAAGMVNSELARRTRRAAAETELGDALGGGSTSVELSGDTLTVAAVADSGGTSDSREIPIRVRGEDQDRRQSTFVSRHDESVQTFAYRLPADYDSGSGAWDLAVSLHGANVPPINQAGANISRDRLFVVAPAARGPVNYDHEDLGRLDDLEAIDVMAERFDIDPNRVFLTGHSMGGHGTWHVGLTNPDRFAALAPSAGWTDHETYITVVWARDKLHSYPQLKAVKETALQKNLAMPKTRNAADGTLPTFVLQGGKDTAVPSMQPRSYLRTLANRGLDVEGKVGRRLRADPASVDVAYLEVPQADHYWDADEFGEPTIGPGKDTINHPDMWNFLRANTRDPYPDELTFYTTNLRVEDEKRWVRVVEQERVHEPTIVEGQVTGDGIELTTTNVARLDVDTRVLGETTGRSAGRVTVNGTARGLNGRRGKRVGIDLRNGVSVGTPGGNARLKGPDAYGPMTEIHHRPYRLVYGTAGSAAETARNRNLANVRSQRLVDRARAPATVIPDTAVTDDIAREYNLVLFGRPSTNELLDDYQSGVPITVEEGAVTVGEQTYTGDLGVEYVYPNPRASDRLVQVETGTSPAGLELTRVRDWTPTQTAAADYQVFDESIRYQAWNANLAAGFFDKRWQLDDDLGVIRDVDY